MARKKKKDKATEDLTVKELREQASEADIEGRSSMDKDELVDALTEDSEAKTPAQIRATKEYQERKEAGETDSAILADLDETRGDEDNQVSEQRASGVTYDQADEAQKKSKKKG